jgi:beta-phosphoglucomutase
MHSNNIIFDLDGTIVDAKELHHASFEWAIQQQLPDFILTDTLKEELEGIPSLNKLDILNNSGYKLEVERAYYDKQTHTEQHLDLMSWDPELPYLIKEASNVYNMAVCSNARSRFVYSTLNLLGLSCFNAVYSADVIPLIMRKPNPFQFVTAMAQLNMDPAHTIIFEDSIPGLQAANSSGVQCVIAVKDSYDTKEQLKKLLLL